MDVSADGVLENIALRIFILWSVRYAKKIEYN